jgi:hypothetical protein
LNPAVSLSKTTRIRLKIWIFNMEIIIPNTKTKTPVHPLEIFRQARKFCWQNRGKLSAIYAILNLPLTLISLSPQMRVLENQKPGLVTWVWFLLLVVISSWGSVALLLGVKKIVAGEACSVWQSINRAQVLLVKYLILLVSIILFIFGVVVTAGISTVLILTFVARINMILTLALCFIVIVTAVSVLVYFLLRWSLATVVCVFEQLWPMPVLNGSRVLIQDYVNPLAGLYGLMILAYGIGLAPVLVMLGLIGAKAESAPAQVGATLYLFLINLVLVPLWSCVTVVLYNKLQEIAKTNVHA